MKKNLNKDLVKIHDFYVSEFIKTLGKKYHVNPKELLDLWNDRFHQPPTEKQKQPFCLKTRKEQEQQQKLWDSLCMLKYDDLSRHCLKNGIQPPLQKDDMIKAIIAKVYRS